MTQMSTISISWRPCSDRWNIQSSRWRRPDQLSAYSRAQALARLHRHQGLRACHCIRGVYNFSSDCNKALMCGERTREPALSSWQTTLIRSILPHLPVTLNPKVKASDLLCLIFTIFFVNDSHHGQLVRHVLSSLYMTGSSILYRGPRQKTQGYDWGKCQRILSQVNAIHRTANVRLVRLCLEML